MSRQNVKLSRAHQPIGDEHEVIYVSKKHGVKYIRSGSGKGMDFSHPVQVDLSNYEEVDDNVLFRIYHLKKTGK